MIQKIIDWLENNMQPCPYKQRLGIDCPGCGMQRALIELLKGNIVESLVLYPALIPMILLFIFLILHIIFNFKHGAFVLKSTFILSVSIVFIQYSIKTILHFL